MRQTTFDDVRPTRNGTEPYDAKSALQKSIRRGLEEDALYWAAELAGWNPESLWKRLRVIASEDIGLASPSAALTVRALYENWRDAQKDGEGEGRLFITHRVRRRIGGTRRARLCLRPSYPAGACQGAGISAFFRSRSETRELRITRRI